MTSVFYLGVVREGVLISLGLFQLIMLPTSLAGFPLERGKDLGRTPCNS